MNKIDKERDLIGIIYECLDDINFNVSLSDVKVFLNEIKWKLNGMELSKAKKEYLLMALDNISKLNNRITIEKRIKQVLDIIQYWK